MLPREPFRPGHRAPRAGSTAGGRHAENSTAPARPADTLTAPHHRPDASPTLADSRTLDLTNRRTSHRTAEQRRSSPAPRADWRDTPTTARSAPEPRRTAGEDWRDSPTLVGRRRSDRRGAEDRAPNRRADESSTSRRSTGDRRAARARRTATATAAGPRRGPDDARAPSARAGSSATDTGPVRGSRRCGTRRRPAVARSLREPQRAMQLVMSGLGALIMAGVCGLSAFFVVADERHGRQGGAVAAAAAQSPGRDITSRTVDPAPLTVDEAFPSGELNLTGSTGPYRVLLTHADSDCRLATSGEIATLLESLGCTQVVRATMTAPDSRYLVTAGLFNLADEPGATRAHEQVKTMLDAGRGRLTGMAAGNGTRVLDTAPAQFGWHSRGHFLTYCVLVRTDGLPVSDNDPIAQRILYEMVESHLRQGVLGRRATNQA